MLFWNWISLWSPGWSWTQDPPACQDYRCVPPHLAWHYTFFNHNFHNQCYEEGSGVLNMGRYLYVQDLYSIYNTYVLDLTFQYKGKYLIRQHWLHTKSAILGYFTSGLTTTVIFLKTFKMGQLSIWKLCIPCRIWKKNKGSEFSR
jgi:hypothetical protein